MKNRRQFITLLGGAAAWPVVAHAQQGERIRRIGLLTGGLEADSDGQDRYAAFRQAMQQLGWTEGRNVRYDQRTRSGGNIIDVMRRNAAELVALSPDVILVSGARNVEALQQATRTIPIVFASLTDPVGAGLVESLARPGGNTTGFTSFEYELSTKWIELLKEVAPRLSRVGVVRERGSSLGIGLWAAMQGVAPSLGIELKPVGVRDS
jgi:putative ABC transport system substrate-binding protein